MKGEPRQKRGSMQHEIQEAFSVNAIVFFTIFAMINVLMDDEFKRNHEILIVVFAILRIMLGLGVILPEKTKAIRLRNSDPDSPNALLHTTE